MLAVACAGVLVPATAHGTARLAPANLSMTSLSPSVITADGAARASATVRLSDALGKPVSGDASQLRGSSDDPLVRFAAVQDDGNGTYTVTAIASTTAHRILITVTEASSGLSASEPLTLVHGAARNVDVTLAPATLTADGLSSTTATVVVSDAFGNRIAGDALAFSSSQTGVRFGPVTDVGGGVYRSTLHSANAPGTATIRVTDLSASPAATGSATLTQTRAPSLLNATILHWSFFYTASYTSVRSLYITGAPANGSIVLSCTGGGCPSATTTIVPSRQPKCAAHVQHPCRSGANLILTPRLANRRLKVGTRLIITIVRPGWIGKYYSFRVRAGATPALRVSCLAPGSSQPGVGC